MRVVILTFGSRGDVQPYVALGLGLQRAGHEVRLLASKDFAPFVTQYGLGFIPADEVIDGRQLLAEWMDQFSRAGRNPVRMVAPFLRTFRGKLDRMADAMLAASGDADLLVGSVTGVPGRMIARKLGIAFAFAVLLPIATPTGSFPSPFWPGRRSHGPRFNRLTHEVMGRLGHLLERYALNAWQRDRLGLASMPFVPPPDRTPWLYGFSEQLIRRPEDWPDRCHVTGHWFLDEPPGWRPPADLVAFLAAGPPPVYVGFGSMISRAPAATTHLVLEALARTGQRGVIAAGWGGLENVDVPDTVYQLGEVPHGWLFPQMAAVVHHGGAGTSAAGLRAGVPAVVVPHFGDQFYWGSLLHERGCGSVPVLRRVLTADRLVAAIRHAVDDPYLRARVRRVGEAIRAENGVGNAVRALEAIGHAGAPSARQTRGATPHASSIEGPRGGVVGHFG